MELIIVYPDDKGYGLTLSSDIPVQVQTLKKGKNFALIKYAVSPTEVAGLR